MDTALTAASLEDIRAELSRANQAFNRAHPGESGLRQPMHSVYGGAHLFKADTAPKMGAVALRALQEYAPDFAAFAKALKAWKGPELKTFQLDAKRVVPAVVKVLQEK